MLTVPRTGSKTTVTLTKEKRLQISKWKFFEF